MLVAGIASRERRIAGEFATQRFVECLADYEAAVGKKRFVTIVVSDPEDRPANAPNWLPWAGPY